MGVKYNIIATVGTTEVDLSPYPGGSSTVPNDKNRNIYTMILTNTAASANTLTIRIYKGVSLETSVSIILGVNETKPIVSEKYPLLVVPPGRTLKAIASAASVSILMTGEDT